MDPTGKKSTRPKDGRDNPKRTHDHLLQPGPPPPKPLTRPATPDVRPPQKGSYR